MSAGSPASSSSGASPGDQILIDESESRPDGPHDDSPAAAATLTSRGENARGKGAGTATTPIEITIDYETPEDDASFPSPNQPGTKASEPSGPNQQTRASRGATRHPRDGRVRNPVPSKLQNKANEKDGNFSVMHMNFRKKPQMDARDLAAKRSSEATQAAALDAMKDGYRSLKRSKYIWKPQSPEPSTRSPEQKQAPSQTPYMPPPTYPLARPSGPAPHDVKAEQARLLTLLRSLHPVLVVDQLCKALAYFGGIPGAPPPTDHGGFPQSDQNNGSGAFIVGWLSEIFPPTEMPPSSSYPESLRGLTEKDTEQAGNASSSVGAGVTGRRPRGRPKGSKSSKARKDKGIKKGPKTNAEGQEAEPNASSSQAAPTNQSNHDAAAAADIRPPEPPELSPEAWKTQGTQPSTVATSTGAQREHDSSVMSTPGSRKRGRPKGSKNRPKPLQVDLTQSRLGSGNDAPASQESPAVNAATTEANDANEPYQSHYTTNQIAQRTNSATEATLSQHAQNWTDPPSQSPRHHGRPNEHFTGDNSRKRRLEHSAPDPNGTAQGNQASEPSQQHQWIQNQPLESAQGGQGKRRRISKETGSAPASRSLDPQLSRPELSTPTGMSSGMLNNSTPTPTSGSFGSQSSRNGASNARPRSGQVGQHPQRQFMPSPQQQFQPPSNQPPTVQLDMRSRSGTGESFSHQQRQQQQQQQHLGKSGSNGPRRTNNGGNSAQFSSNQHGNQQASTVSSSASTSYPSVGDSQYLNMEYAMSASRAMQQGNAPTSFGSQGSLEAGMTEPQMQGRLYNTYGRR